MNLVRRRGCGVVIPLHGDAHVREPARLVLLEEALLCLWGPCTCGHVACRRANQSTCRACTTAPLNSSRWDRPKKIVLEDLHTRARSRRRCRCRTASKRIAKPHGVRGSMRATCGTDVHRMRVACVPHPCRSYATYVWHVCRVHAAVMSHACRMCVA